MRCTPEHKTAHTGYDYDSNDNLDTITVIMVSFRESRALSTLHTFSGLLD